MRLALAFISLILVSGCAALVAQRVDRAETRATAQWPPLGQIVQVGGLRVHAYVAGSGPDLVLIHGASGNLRDFTFDLVDRLQDRYRVIAFDRPGLGYTDRTDPAYGRAFANTAESPQEQAALLAAAARQLGADRPLVLGHSYGGSVAMAWAVEQQAAGVVSLGGAVMPWPGELGRQYRVLGSSFGGALVPPFVTAFATPDRINQTVASIFAPQTAPDGYADYVGPGLTLRPDSLRANARQVNSLRPHLVSLSARYGDLSLPVEFVHGRLDDTVPLQVHAGPASGLIPGAKLTVLEGIGHMPHHADPETVIAAIDRVAERAGLR